MQMMMWPSQQCLRGPHLALPVLRLSRLEAHQLQGISRLRLALQGECESVTSWPERVIRLFTLALVGVCVRATRRRELQREI
jgi:hypothetical protein